MKQSTWIWMEGKDKPLADSIPPVNEKDKRPAVKDLIEEHRQGIDEVKTELERDPLYAPSKHDDLWILRFLLSHKKAKRAAQAAKYTLQFRQEHNLDAKDIRYAPPGSENMQCDALKRFLVYAKPDFMQGAVPDPRLSVILFLVYPNFDQHKLVANVAEEDWLPSFCYINEWSFQWCDYITRTTGRLTKFVRIVDVNGMKMSSVSREQTLRDGNAMSKMEDCYPQAMQGIIVCNPPSWAAMVWKGIKLIMPKRVVEKIDFISPLKNPKEKKRLIPYIADEHLPVRFGGQHQPWPVEHPLPK